jgi:hypothetical protein
MKENYIDGSCGMKMRIRFWWENVKESDLEDIGVDGKIILKMNVKVR